MVPFALSPAHAKYPNCAVLQCMDRSNFTVDGEFNDDKAIVLGQMLSGEHGEYRTESLLFNDNPGISEHGAQALANGISQSKLQCISFKGRETTMDQEIKRVLLKGIAASNSVEWLVEHSPDSESMADTCRCLKSSQNIVNFDFQVTPSLTVYGARLFARNVGGSKLTKLSMSHSWLTFMDVEITRQLCKGIQKIKTLKSLEFVLFRFNSLNVVLPGMMKSLCSLEHLTIGNFGRFPPSLCASLKLTSSLTSLQIKEGVMLEPDVRRLSIGLRNSSVTKLIVAGTCIDDACLQSFLELWPLDSQIQELDFSGNRIGPDGALILVRAANDHPALEKLNLSNNPIGYPGLAAIGSHLQNLQLKCLSFFFSDESSIHHGDEANAGAKAIKIATKTAAVALVEGIKVNTRTDLVVFGGTFSTEAEEEISFYSHLNMNGRYLLSTDHGLASSIWCNILARKTGMFDRDVMYYFLLEQPHLVHVRPSSQPSS